jgi:hypothetical protein
MAAYANVELPLALMYSLNGIFFRKFPSAAIRINSADMRDVAVWIVARVLIYALHSNSHSHVCILSMAT